MTVSNVEQLHFRRDAPDLAPEDGSDLDLATSPPGGRRQRIRCPLCEWEPDGGKHWQCERCFTMFDTFATRAHCPVCPNSWHLTQCIRCSELTPHEDWYVDEAEPPGSAPA